MLLLVNGTRVFVSKCIVPDEFLKSILLLIGESLAPKIKRIGKEVGKLKQNVIHGTLLKLTASGRLLYFKGEDFWVWSIKDKTLPCPVPQDKHFCFSKTASRFNVFRLQFIVYGFIIPKTSERLYCLCWIINERVRWCHMTRVLHSNPQAWISKIKICRKCIIEFSFKKNSSSFKNKNMPYGE